MSARAVDRMADVVALLCKAPRTVPEIQGLLGVGHGNAESAVREFVAALHGEGLVYIVGTRPPQGRSSSGGHEALVYGWQPTIQPVVRALIDVPVLKGPVR